MTNTADCLYIIEVHREGVLLRPGSSARGVPISAIREVTRMLRSRAVLDAGISHHFGCPVAVGRSKADAEVWKQKISSSIAHLPAQERWWRGTDVGLSSAAIFGALSDCSYAAVARKFGEGRVPRDADDFGRCVRMLNNIPAFRINLDEVAQAYPDTAWPSFISSWVELESLYGEALTTAIQDLIAAHARSKAGA